jgi:hypothetical protein
MHGELIEHAAAIQHFALTNVDDSDQDITILNYIAQATFHVADQLHKDLSILALPATHIKEISGGYMHRVVINTRVPINQMTLPFVSFVSKKQANIMEDVEQDITNIDEAMISGLVRQSALLSYSSFQLAERDWYNLVLFSQASAKQDMLSVQLHQLAAYELAPRYYQWIRLHHGTITRNDAVTAITFQLTKYYRFHTGTKRPEIRFHTCQPVKAIPEIAAP